ncbi:MAG: HlyD family efflux transporter periplasmic adaptor subunit [Stappiaceae bacterium]
MLKTVSGGEPPVPVVSEPTEPGAISTERQSGSATRTFFFIIRAVLQIVIAFAVLFGAYRFMNYMVATKPDVPTRPPREQTYTVETLPLQLGDNRPVISLYGEIVTGRVVELRALVGGEINNVSPDLKVGATVNKTAEIVTIDDFAYRGAVVEAEANILEAKARLAELEHAVELQRDNIVSAQVQLDLAQKDLQRAENLLTSGNVTERVLDDRKLIVSQRKQSLEQLNNTLAVEKARITQQTAVLQRLEWRLEQAQRDVRDTVLKVPFDAVVRSQNAEIGRLVGVNDVVATLYDRNELEVRFTLSDEQFGRLVSESGSLTGKEVEVVWFIGSEPKIYSAIVNRVGADVASARGGVDVFARIQSEGAEFLLRPGAFVQLRIPDVSYANSVIVPEAAVYDGTHVFLRSAESRMERRDVAIQAYANENVILSGDLKDGDILITTRIAEAGEGLLVKIPGEKSGADKRQDRAKGKGGGDDAAETPKPSDQSGNEKNAAKD